MFYMNSVSRPPPAPADLVLQRIIVDRPIAIQDLYWRTSTIQPTAAKTFDKRAHISGGTLRIQPHTVLSFDTYFNAFFEPVWRRYTRLGNLLLRITVEGPCTLRLTRRALGARRIVHEQLLESGTVTIAVSDQAVNFRQHGLLGFAIATGSEVATLLDGAWLAEGAGPAASAVGLGAVICTFNREAEVGRVLSSIADDAALRQTLPRIFVINQGQPGLAGNPNVAAAGDKLDGRLRVVEQPNFGGAGGFSRGLLEALDDPQLTHAVLLDDDITLEPDSLSRMAAFFALCRAPIVLGGHMLDSVQPTMLYEAGAIISDRHWAFQPQHHGSDLDDPDVLDALSAPIAVHYNGWWCCGIPLSLVRDYGLPLPCFIRGDDVEYGLRLHQAGIPTVCVPGVAVWHDPFYLKIGGWHLYYETRNMLIAASLHQSINRWDVARRMGRHLAMNLLTFRYYNAALILQGIRDFLVGPSILAGAPQALHAQVMAIRRHYPAVSTARGVVLEPQQLRLPPRSTAGFLWTLLGLTLGNLISATAAAPRRLMPVRDLAWPMMRGVEHVAVETWWDEELPTFHRSREHFRRLAFEAARTLFALARQAPDQARQWQAGFKGLTSEAFWRNYLGVAPASPSSTAEPLAAQAPLTSEAVS